MGVLFLYAGHFEKVIFDKEKNQIITERTNIFCKKKTGTYSLKSVKGVELNERGRESLTTNTIHFIIRLKFTDDRPDLNILESVNKKATERKVRNSVHFIWPDLYDL